MQMISVESLQNGEVPPLRKAIEQKGNYYQQQEQKM